MTQVMFLDFQLKVAKLISEVNVEVMQVSLAWLCLQLQVIISHREWQRNDKADVVVYCEILL